MSDRLPVFLADRLDEDEELARTDAAPRPDRLRLGWADGVPLTLPERVLGQVRTRRAVLSRYRGSQAGTPAQASLHRQVVLMAAEYDTHPGFDPSWTTPS